MTTTAAFHGRPLRPRAAGQPLLAVLIARTRNMTLLRETFAERGSILRPNTQQTYWFRNTKVRWATRPASAGKAHG
ncbi:MAG: hypothetical protein Q8J76_09750 [Desulfobulbaceae bacterium]|nr:hypothetical protein [Desulfobulbaceae bacterium]